MLFRAHCSERHTVDGGNLAPPMVPRILQFLISTLRILGGAKLPPSTVSPEF